MKNLNGLWKIEDGKVLVQLHGADTIDYHATQKIRSVKGTLRVIRGDWHVRDATSPLILTSVLPKHDMTITIIDVSFHHTHDDDYYSIEGVAERKDRYEYGPGTIKTAYDELNSLNDSVRAVAIAMMVSSCNGPDRGHTKK